MFGLAGLAAPLIGNLLGGILGLARVTRVATAAMVTITTTTTIT